MAKELRPLYDRGEFLKCLEAVQKALVDRPSDDSENGELIALGAWCFYRGGDYGNAKSWAEKAGPVRFARECLGYLAAYAKGYKNDEKLRELIAELGDSVNVANALIIRGREADSTLNHDDVMTAASRFREDAVEVANLSHNAGRFFFQKARNDGDFVTALGFLDLSLARYGKDRNWHHRGAVYFWKSQILERLFDKRAALESARESLYCWTQQRILDPGNQQHKQQWENAVQRIRDLLG